MFDFISDKWYREKNDWITPVVILGSLVLFTFILAYVFWKSR
jgi:hypothetical protein